MTTGPPVRFDPITAPGSDDDHTWLPVWSFRATTAPLSSLGVKTKPAADAIAAGDEVPNGRDHAATGDHPGGTATGICVGCGAGDEATAAGREPSDHPERVATQVSPAVAPPTATRKATPRAVPRRERRRVRRGGSTGATINWPAAVITASRPSENPSSRARIA